MKILLLPIIPTLLFGTLLYLYNRRKGYTSLSQLVLNYMLFYVAFYLAIKYLLVG